MVHWTITRADQLDQLLRAGDAAGVGQAWVQAAAAVLDELTADNTLTGCMLTADDAAALLIGGRATTGQLDLLATSAAAERLVRACAGETETTGERLT